MSSFIGHALTGAGIYLSTAKRDVPPKRLPLVWVGWLIVAALAPDLDYVVPMLHRSAHDGLRVTHSIAFALIIPAITFIALTLSKLPATTRSLWSRQIIFAGLSHLILDMLVGVTVHPIFWPLTSWTVHLPVGVLPSAPGYSITNYYLYRNTFIELGIFVPLWLGVYWFRQAPSSGLEHHRKSYPLWLIAMGFLWWGYTLAR